MFLVVDFPSLLHVPLLLLNSFLCHRLLLLQIGEKLILVVLFDLGFHFHMMAKSLIVGHFSLILLIIEHLFAIEQFFMKLLDRITELIMPLFQFEHLLLLGPICNNFHLAIGVFSHFYFLV